MKCIYALFLFLTVSSCLYGKTNFGRFGIRERDAVPDSLRLATNIIRVNGIVEDEKGVPIPGAHIVEKGTYHGVVSDKEGQFSLSVPADGELVISFVGYKTLFIPIQGKAFLRVHLEEDMVFLKDVVVTALGIEKSGVSLPYSVTQIGQDELIRIKDPNLFVALMGKVAGLQIHKSASGTGGSVRVLLRGIRSVAGNNQPLFVIDGIPILNESSEQAYTAIGGTADAGNRDGGDGISNLNPEDIESISVLKGASASALYGTQAANGVILIKTKKGLRGKQEVQFSSSMIFEKAINLPEFQNHYGVSDGIESWGERDNLKKYNAAKDFFRTGISAIHSLSFSTGNEIMQTYFSYANTAVRGIVPQHRFMKHNINLKETASFFEGRLKLDGNLNLMRQKMKNRPTPGGFYMNPLVGLYRFPRGEDISKYKKHFELLDEKRNLMVQNWHSSVEDFEQNPYWVTNRILSEDIRSRAIVSLTADVKITTDLSVQGRVSIDDVSDKFRQRFYASTAPALAGENGRYIDYTYQQTLLYGDLLATYRRLFGKFTFHMTLGTSINNNTISRLRYDSKTASLKYANVFTVANINMNTSAYIEEQNRATRQMQSLFTTIQIGYGDFLFLDVSARNDWSSTLAFTSHESTGFFYPSLGIAWALNKTLNLPKWVDLAKLRVSWSRVGNDIPLYITNPMSYVLAGGGVQSADAAPFEEMKPEMNNSIELGTEWRCWLDRLYVDFTYYRTNTRNQFFKLPAQDGDEYAYRYVNAGNIQNVGVEFSVGGIPVIFKEGKWESKINFATNKNKVLRLHEELPVFIYGPRGFSSSYAMKLREGGSFGDIYGKAFKRDEHGEIVYEAEGEKSGLPQIVGEGNTVKVGNANPNFTLSWSNNLRYRGFSFHLLLDGRFGGDVLSQTQADLDMFGVTKATGKARDKGFVELEGKRITDVEGFYKGLVGGRAGVTEYYIYDATNIRLRELSIGYTLPDGWMKKSGIFKSVQVNFVARNLCFLYKKAPFDPDLVLSTGSDNQAIEVYGMPTTRNIGFNIYFTF
ncbi:SusC/RagA family TonB-linked outer membrane protein [Gabonibacter massiliensis]|uniref:SusC/RagA family TonB-linked outer membrane protein n=1 Tax=Gabonibacter massiliensis TaxID=1720195 RepID=UPI0009E6F1C6|nr:SusC/RagA family TonB-linked outer membrane protein [Gabonibacter massiliensis]